MNKLLKIIINILLIGVLIGVFKNSTILRDSVINSITLWINNIVPSLFPIFVLNDLIIRSNFLNIFTDKINIITNKILNLSGNSFEIILLSFLSGTPAAAYIIKENLNNNNIDIKSANKLISYTYFGNPLFLYNNLISFYDKNITIKIIFAHYISNIIIGLLYKNKPVDYINYKNKNMTNNYLKFIPSAISSSMNIMIMILGTISFYMIITLIITNAFNLNNNILVLIKGLIEITQGINELNIISNNIKKEIITLFIISFGGISIHTQTYSLIKDTNIKYINFFKGRIMHILISLITYIIIRKY